MNPDKEPKIQTGVVPSNQAGNLRRLDNPQDPGPVTYDIDPSLSRPRSLRVQLGTAAATVAATCLALVDVIKR